MSNKILLDRLSRMVKVQPRELPSFREKFNGNSWSENSKHFVPTEQKINAIKMTEREVPCYQPMVREKKKPLTMVLKKWIENCAWKLPKAILVFSVVQVRETHKSDFAMVQ